MKKHIFDENNKHIETLDADPVCGEDFCDKCGDCLACDGGDPCYIGNTDDHFWAEYEPREMPILSNRPINPIIVNPETGEKKPVKRQSPGIVYF